MLEIWANIQGIPGYQISTLGHVRSIPRTVNVNGGKSGTIKRTIPGKMLNPTPTYILGRQHYCTLRLNGKTYYLHHLMARTFLGPPPFGPKTEVNHKDGNRHNNVLSNIEWCSHAMNERHAISTLKANRKARGIEKAEPPQPKREKRKE